MKIVYKHTTLRTENLSPELLANPEIQKAIRSQVEKQRKSKPLNETQEKPIAKKIEYPGNKSKGQK
jgi:hypothetical protein